jgi:3',5'-nucleoside bisphosphate phosphatase
LDRNKYTGIDLHIHSTASDGSVSPNNILSMAKKLRLKAIAITDHDTLHGSKKAIAFGIPSDLQFVTGVEMSTAGQRLFPGIRSLHILGYGIRLDDPDLNSTLHELQKARKGRNPRIVKRLQDLGFDLTYQEVMNETGEHSQTGRPHIALVMKKKGFVSSINEAFDKYLGEEKPAYVDKFRADCAQAIRIIINSGGIPVLAHPHVLLAQSQNYRLVEELVLNLKEMGLKGIEAYYPKHAKYTACFIDIARRHNLIMTGGTDFHGSMKPDVQMGFGNGNFNVPCELYDKLISSL